MVLTSLFLLLNLRDVRAIFRIGFSFPLQQLKNKMMKKI